ncbi:MAG: DUF1566 domain-containing protein [Deltaproteobacteria bacterium]|nr:DUF1566 domain-containing protein [Deltaproteobacteria bacterium]
MASDAGAVDNLAPDTARVDASGPIGCPATDDYKACHDGVGICFGTRCYLPGTCEQALCNFSRPAFTLADTNLRQCYSDTATIPCPSPSQVFFGQDFQYGWDTSHGSSTRFGRSTAVDDEPIVRDNVTGLVWQGCAAGRHGRDCSAGTVEFKNWQDARTYCDGLTWGNLTDWYLPNEHELQSIVDYGRGAPAIDVDAFPATPSNYFWTSSSTAYYSDHGFYVNFSYGDLNSNSKENASPVRCVRTGT